MHHDLARQNLVLEEPFDFAATFRRTGFGRDVGQELRCTAMAVPLTQIVRACARPSSRVAIQRQPTASRPPQGASYGPSVIDHGIRTSGALTRGDLLDRLAKTTASVEPIARATEPLRRA
jgi:hypothetical protein